MRPLICRWLHPRQLGMFYRHPEPTHLGMCTQQLGAVLAPIAKPPRSTVGLLDRV